MNKLKDILVTSISMWFSLTFGFYSDEFYTESNDHSKLYNNTKAVIELLLFLLAWAWISVGLPLTLIHL